MSPEDTKFLAGWGRARRQSRRAYVTKHGVLYWGIPVGIWTCAGLWFFQPESITARHFFGYGLSGAVIGMIRGLYEWDKYETRFRSLTGRGSGTDRMP